MVYVVCSSKQTFASSVAMSALDQELHPAVHKKAAAEGVCRTWQVDGGQPLGTSNSNAQEGCRNGGGILS